AGEQCFAAPVLLGEAELVRAVPGDGAATALLDVMVRESPNQASFDFHAYGPLRSLAGERAMLVDQTHESVVVAELAVVKWMVDLEPTPAPTLIEHLSSVGFTQMPLPWGFVSWGADAPLVVATVTDYLPGATDGWRWCVDDVGELGLGLRSMASCLPTAAELGELVARLHVALASTSAVIPQPVHRAESGDVRSWTQTARALLEEAVQLVGGAEGERLRSRVSRIREAIEGVAVVDSAVTIPVHGDLHVGQILRWDGGYAVNDFDGNPVLAASDRLLPQPAARDVAGMLQSLDHVGRVVLRRVEGVDASRVVEWIAAAQDTFLTSYKTSLSSLNQSRLLDERFLLPFRVEQECREFVYAEKHLPRWRYVPDAALQALFP
ncbi:MAG: aminoglycoside phosphotransferase, partial [Candidatus Nanopelagicales bacterium]